VLKCILVYRMYVDRSLGIYGMKQFSTLAPFEPYVGIWLHT
jgi:hypothetical protein